MRKVLALLLLVLSFGCTSGGDDNGGGISTDSCSILGLPTKSISLRIVNGTDCADLNRSPVVRVVLFNALGIPEGFCSGTMITSNDVLTAAHCFVTQPASAAIAYGDPGDVTLVSARSVTIHPGLTATPGAVLNDVAVLQLSQSVPLPTMPLLGSVAPQVGDIGSIYGYGTNEAGDFDGADLESGQMQISDVTANHIVAEFKGDGSNTCQGDSGGPIVLQVGGVAALAGVTSSGTRTDCAKGDVSLFADVQSESILDFIRDVVPDAAIL